MLHASQAVDAWVLEGAIGALRCGLLGARVDLSRPEFGVHALQFEGASLAGRLFCLTSGDAKSWPAAVGDAYVRGHDLVGSYTASDAWPYAPQIYWNAGAHNVRKATLAELSLLVSIQTPLLDTHPKVDVRSQLAAEEMLCIRPIGDDNMHVESLPEGGHSISPTASASCVLWRLNDRPISYVEATAASDFHDLEVHVAPGGECESRWRLFAEFLEKGVIRRARVHAAFLPRENDVQLAADFCRAIERRPLPLTT